MTTPKKKQEPRIAYSTEEVKAKTGLGRNTIWRAMKAGRLRYSHVGTRRVIMADDMLAWLMGGNYARGNMGATSGGGLEGDAGGRAGNETRSDGEADQ